MPMAVSEMDLVAVVSHHRRSSNPGPAVNSPFIDCVRHLIGLPVSRLAVVVVTNQPTDTERLLVRALGRSTTSHFVSIEAWRPLPFRRHGFYLTWQHKDTFRRVLSERSPTHLLYTEDDIGFRGHNLAYWLAARAALASHGLLPSFVRFEHVHGARMLVDYTQPGMHIQAVEELEVSGLGTVSAQRVLAPYQACYLYDRELAKAHLRASNMRSPLRSEVSGWGVRERAAAGSTFSKVPTSIASIVPGPYRKWPRSRHATLIDRSGARGLLEGALIEHLRPAYASQPASPFGKVPVERF
jgi:hypothetical protein